MKLVMFTNFAKIDTAEAVKLIAEAGFDAVDLSLFRMNNEGDALAGPDYKQEVERIRAAAEECGMTFEQAHAPFRFKNQADYEGEVLPLTLRAIEIAGMLGVKTMVVHPIHYGDYRKSKDEMRQKSVAYYRALIPYCEKYGVKVAFENMWQCNEFTRYIEDDTCSSAEEFASWFDEINSHWITGCLDLGHCPIVGRSTGDFIRHIGADRIGCLHVHDNDFLHDSHTQPYFGKMDWDDITAALKEVGYKGNFTYETDTFLSRLPQELWLDGLKFQERIGRHLIKKIEG